MDCEITLNDCWLLLKGNFPYQDKHHEVIERVHMSQWSFFDKQDYFTGSKRSCTGGLHGQQLLTRKTVFGVLCEEILHFKMQI